MAAGADHADRDALADALAVVQARFVGDNAGADVILGNSDNRVVASMAVGLVALLLRGTATAPSRSWRSCGRS